MTNRIFHVLVLSHGTIGPGKMHARFAVVIGASILTLSSGAAWSSEADDSAARSPHQQVLQCAQLVPPGPATREPGDPPFAFSLTNLAGEHIPGTQPKTENSDHNLILHQQTQLDPQTTIARYFDDLTKTINNPYSNPDRAAELFNAYYKMELMPAYYEESATLKLRHAVRDQEISSLVLQSTMEYAKTVTDLNKAIQRFRSRSGVIPRLFQNTLRMLLGSSATPEQKIKNLDQNADAIFEKLKKMQTKLIDLKSENQDALEKINRKSVWLHNTWTIIQGLKQRLQSEAMAPPPSESTENQAPITQKQLSVSALVNQLDIALIEITDKISQLRQLKDSREIFEHSLKQADTALTEARDMTRYHFEPEQIANAILIERDEKEDPAHWHPKVANRVIPSGVRVANLSDLRRKLVVGDIVTLFGPQGPFASNINAEHIELRKIADTKKGLLYFSDSLREGQWFPRDSLAIRDDNLIYKGFRVGDQFSSGTQVKNKALFTIVSLHTDGSLILKKSSISDSTSLMTYYDRFSAAEIDRQLALGDIVLEKLNEQPAGSTNTNEIHNLEAVRALQKQ